MRLRSIVEITKPEVEPVSLTAAKGQIGLLAEQEEDHDLILRAISAGRELVEKRLGRSLAARRFRATFVADDGSARARLPAPPLLLTVSHPLEVTVGGVVVSPASYTVDADSRPAELLFASMPALPSDGSLQVTFWGGPPPGEPIEAGLESAILLYVAHVYRHREAVVTGTIATDLPVGIETLLAAHSVTGAW